MVTARVEFGEEPAFGCEGSPSFLLSPPMNRVADDLRPLRREPPDRLPNIRIDVAERVFRRASEVPSRAGLEHPKGALLDEVVVIALAWAEVPVRVVLDERHVDSDEDLCGAGAVLLE